MSNLIIAQCIIVLIGIFVFSIFFRKKREVLLPIPPGPKPIPILGNIRDGPPPGVPDFQHWLTLKDKYGPISSVTVMGQTMVFIHDQDAAIELLEKKVSLRTSGRPTFPFARLCGFDEWITLIDYDDRLRLYRKLIHQQIGTKLLSSQYTDIQDVESKRFLLRVLRQPDNLFNHIKTEAASIILKLTYGYSTELYKPDPLVKLIEEVMILAVDAATPWRWAYDFFPALAYLPEWFPGGGFKKAARDRKAKVHASANVPYDFVKQQMAVGTYQDSYCSGLINSFKNSSKDGEDTENAIKWSASVMFAAGSDTTVATITAFMLAMIINPDVQRKAQEEIDRVVGTDRLPTEEDRENLPYVMAVVKESLRTFPVVPLGLPHKATEEIFFRGYRIPNGSYIIPAVWWFLNNPKVYPEPEKFMPERFLEPRNEPDPYEVFGYGRRVCVGRYVALENLYFTISRVLAAFNIGKAMQGGKPVEVEFKHTAGILDHPAPFSYSIVPRSEKHAELIQRVEVEHPWEGSSAEFLPKNNELDKFREKYDSKDEGRSHRAQDSYM